jgi:hypothetical protein
MIDTLLHLLFRCRHHRLTRPMAPMTKAGTPHSESYVVCLDCGKHFEYDLSRMRIGKAINEAHVDPLAPPRTPSRAKRVTLGVLAAMPVALIFGAAWKVRKKARTEERDRP